MQFAVTLEKAAKAKNISLYALAQKLGVKPNALSVTKHEGYDPKLSTLLRWASILGCPVTDLFMSKGKFIAKGGSMATTKKKPVKKAKKPLTKKKTAKR